MRFLGALSNKSMQLLGLVNIIIGVSFVILILLAIGIIPVSLEALRTTIWVTMICSGLLLIIVELMYLHVYHSPGKSVDAWSLERGRALEKIAEALLLAILIGSASFLIGHSPLFTHYIQQQVVTAMAEVIQDPAVMEKHKHAPDIFKTLRRGAILGSATTLRGHEAKELYEFMEANIFDALHGPVRRGLELDYGFHRSIDKPGVLVLDSTYDWKYVISADSVVERYEVKQPVAFFVIELPGSDKGSAALEVDGKPEPVELEYQRSVAVGDLKEAYYSDEIPVLVEKSKPTHLRLVMSSEIPDFDSVVYTSRYPTDGVELEVRWEPSDVMKNLQLWAFSATKGTSARQDPETGTCSRGQTYCKWVYGQWLLPGCGLILTWQTGR